MSEKLEKLLKEQNKVLKQIAENLIRIEGDILIVMNRYRVI